MHITASPAEFERDRSATARRRRARLVAEMAAATPEPEPYAVAPLGDGWTVVNPDASARIRPRQDWTLAMATLAMVGLNAMPEVAVQFEWVAA